MLRGSVTGGCSEPAYRQSCQSHRWRLSFIGIPSRVGLPRGGCADVRFRQSAQRQGDWYIPHGIMQVCIVGMLGIFNLKSKLSAADYAWWCVGAGRHVGRGPASADGVADRSCLYCKYVPRRHTDIINSAASLTVALRCPPFAFYSTLLCHLTDELYRQAKPPLSSPLPSQSEPKPPQRRHPF